MPLLISLQEFRSSHPRRLFLFGIVLPALLGCRPPSATTTPTANEPPNGLAQETHPAALDQQADDSLIEIEGTVTATFFGPDQLGGFFLQSPATEAKPPSGVFVQSRAQHIQPGQHVRVRGTLSANSELTTVVPGGGPVPGGTPHSDELQADQVQVLGSAADLPPLDVPPLADVPDWEQYVGTLVRFPYPLIVTDTYNLARRGQLTLASETLWVPTERVDPNDAEPSGNRFVGIENVAAVTSAADRNRRLQIKLDDGTTAQNVFPIPLLPGLGSDFETIRSGSTVRDLTGIVIQQRGEYFVIPVGKLTIEHQPRPERPDLGESDLVVASFNLLNYFSTIDNGDNEARGADSLEELQRQQDKLVSAITQMDAAVIGLVELENNLAAEQRLVKALNQFAGSEVYRGCGLPDGFSDAPGSDNSIRVGILYRIDRVSPIGPVTMISHDAFEIARTPLVQRFKATDRDAEFTLIVNHFKSKNPRRATEQDSDQNDGQGAYNAIRRRQARAVADHVAAVRESGQPNVLVIGDLNANSQEDPIDLLRDAGLIELSAKSETGQMPSTYLYYGQAGCIDHSFGSPEMADHVTAVAPWNINSPEPRFLDYNTEYNPATLYRPNPFRCSDHDPVLIGLRW